MSTKNFLKKGALLVCCAQVFSFIPVQGAYAQAAMEKINIKSEIRETEVVPIREKTIAPEKITESIKLAPEDIKEDVKLVDPTDLEQEKIEPINPVDPEIIENLPELPEIPENMQTIDGYIPTEPIEITERTGQSSIKDSFDVNGTSGAATFANNLYLPPGRNGMTPTLALNYSSDNKANDSIVGYGWNLTSNYIARSSRYGIPESYETNEFYVSLPGANEEIVAISLTDDHHGEYGAKIEQAFLKYEFLNNDTWKVTDKQGTEYFFGQTANTRQDDPSDSTRIYKWMLDEIRDTNGNWIKYTYYKDAGEIYPGSINYTGHNTDDGPIIVKFQPFYDSPSTLRGDNITKFSTGFSVTTNYILESVEVEIAGENNGYPVIRHDFNYTKSDSNKRNLLTSVTQIGIDSNGQETSLPSTNFTYSDEGDTRWEEPTQGWQVQCILSSDDGSGAVEAGTRMVDINSDGLIDCGSKYSQFLKINNAVDDLVYIPGFSPIPDQELYGFPSVAMMEVNGDGRIDFVKAIEDSGLKKSIYFHNGIDGWTRNSAWNIPTPLFIKSISTGVGAKTGDFNGDGLTDIVLLQDNYSKTREHSTDPWTITHDYILEMYINNGINGWDLDTEWTFTQDMIFLQNYYRYGPPYSYSTRYPKYYDARVMDYNNDGLADIVFGAGGASADLIYLNNGNKGWTTIPNTLVDQFSDHGRDLGVRFQDINGDGLPDYFKGEDNRYELELNNGKEYLSENANWGGEFPQDVPIAQQSGRYRGTELVDLNGDGLLDILYGRHVLSNQNEYYKKVYLNRASIPDLLVNVNNNRGSSIAIEYKNSPEYLDSNNNLENPKLHIPKMTVFRVTYSDDFGGDYEVTYNYEDAEYVHMDSHHNEFGGFHVITKTDNEGMVEKTYYHQGGGIDGSAQGEFNDHISKTGKPYRVEIYNNSNGQLTKYSQSIMKWEYADLGNDRYFPKMTRELTFTFAPGGASGDTANVYMYDDTNGNLIESVSYGEVDANEDGTYSDIGNDTVRSTTTYTNNVADHVIGLPVTEIVYDYTNVKLSETQHFYDNLPLGQVSIGNETSVSRWHRANEYYTTEFIYDAYGNVTQVTDPRGNSTTAVYDGYNMYPDSVTNAKGHTSIYDYEYRNGQPSYMESPNGNIASHTYDSLGRLVQTDISNPANPSSLTKATEIIYEDGAIPNYTETRLYANANSQNPQIKRSFVNGSGQVVQSRSSAPIQGEFIVQDTSYDAKGRTTRSSLPYFASGDAYQPADLSKQANEFTYDILDRVLTTTNILGTTTTSYFIWDTTTLDPEGNQKKLINDAYGRLAEVV